MGNNERLIFKENSTEEMMMPFSSNPYFSLLILKLSNIRKLSFFSTRFFPPSIEKEYLNKDYFPFLFSSYKVISCVFNNEIVPLRVLLQSKSLVNEYLEVDVINRCLLSFSKEGAFIEMDGKMCSSIEYIHDEEINEVEEDADVALTKDNFIPSKKSLIRNLDNDEEEYDDFGEDEEEDDFVNVPIVTPSFSPNSKSKIANLNVNPNFRKKEIKKPKEIVSIPVASFSSNKKEKPKNINEVKSLNVEKYIYKKREYDVNSRVFVFSNDNEALSPYHDEFYKKLKSINRINWTKRTRYCPDKPLNGSIAYSLASKFDVNNFNLLCATVDAYSRPVSYLLSYKKEPNLCFICSADKEASIVGFSSIGVNLVDPYLDFATLLKITSSENKKKKIEEENKIEKEEIDKPIFKEEEIKNDKVAFRRVFILGKTLRKFQKLFQKSPYAKADFDETIEKLLSYNDEELNAYLRSRDNKKINAFSNETVLKFQFGNNEEYQASRLFYCHGYDCKRRLDYKDIIIIGFSFQGEHDNQLDVAINGIKALNNDKELHQLFLRNGFGEKEDIPYLSHVQFDQLKEASENLPSVLTGSAGTGKTLMSVAQYIDLLDKNESILYLTYEPGLLQSVDQMLSSYKIETPSTYTYLNLASYILGEEITTKYKGFDYFRTYFLSFIDSSKSLRKDFSIFKDEKEDVCLACFCFFNGIMEGSRALSSSSDSILSEDEFLRFTKKEEAFEFNIRKDFYLIGKSYHNHLLANSFYSNGLLAKAILAKKDKPLFDNLIIDEYQDLTELMFISILSLLKKNHPLSLYMFGDDNQTIQPTLFSFASCESILKEQISHSLKLNKIFLPSSYRSGPVLIDYINSFNIKKKECIGKQKEEIDKTESSLRDDENDLFVSYIDKEETLLDLVKRSLSSSLSYIFPSLFEKENFIATYTKLGIDKEILSNMSFVIEEAKGMEWDSVVLIRFFSSSKNSFNSMLLNKKGKHSSFHRMLFNRFYVALTRAKNKIVIYENDITPSIKESFLSIPKHISSTELDELFIDSASLSWVSYAKSLFYNGQYKQAYLSLLRAKDKANPNDLKVAKKYSNYEEEFNKNNFSNSSEYIDLFISRNDYGNLKDCYKRSGNRKKLNLFLKVFDKNTSLLELVELYKKSVELCSYQEKVFYFDKISSLILNKIKKEIN